MTDILKTDKRRRVQRLKKLIIFVILIIIAVPCIGCIILGIKLYGANKEVERLRDRMTILEQSARNVKEVFSTSQIENREILADNEKADPDDITEEGMYKVYLTFDDGPSENTAAILDILKEYKVKATFFVVAKNEELFQKDYKRIVEEGHTLGMHSYSHKYDEIYRSLEDYKADLSELQEFLYKITGIWSRYYRFPGGSSNTVSKVDMMVLIDYLKQQDIMYYDWNVESGDTTSGNQSAGRLVENCMKKIVSNRESIVLMHDAAEKDSTVKALPDLIKKIQEFDNIAILPITDETVPIRHLTNDND